MAAFLRQSPKMTISSPTVLSQVICFSSAGKGQRLTTAWHGWASPASKRVKHSQRLRHRSPDTKRSENSVPSRRVHTSSWWITPRGTQHRGTAQQSIIKPTESTAQLTGWGQTQDLCSPPCCYEVGKENIFPLPEIKRKPPGWANSNSFCRFDFIPGQTRTPRCNCRITLYTSKAA